MSESKPLSVVRSIGDVDRSAMLETLDSLRKAVEAGEVTCFVAVGISPNDDSRVWMSNSPPAKSGLQVFGAVSLLYQTFWDWIDLED